MGEFFEVAKIGEHTYLIGFGLQLLQTFELDQYVIELGEFILRDIQYF